MALFQPFTTALTGGFSSGKSTAGQKFSELGAFGIDADEIIRTLLASNVHLVQKITDHLGPGFLNSQQGFDRSTLRHLIFRDLLARSWIENLLHPLVYQKIEQKLTSVDPSQYAIIAYPSC